MAKFTVMIFQETSSPTEPHDECCENKDLVKFFTDAKVQAMAELKQKRRMKWLEKKKLETTNSATDTK